jgi:REP element-mobilizing transposase RayT
MLTKEVVMPRQARLDVPGLVYHVMSRGIEGRDIFLGNKDREQFLERLSEITACKGGPTLYAWALMSNHFHLLVRSGDTHLSTAMQKLMTGYAVNFNKKHKRIGHLFQNRYKSIAVEEDSYFLELVRYIHLNPLRAGVVKSCAELEKYRYTGHAVILGKREYPIQHVDEVLAQFSDSRSSALQEYRSFVVAGMDQGPREDLRGGGLVRSAGGLTAVLARHFEERESYDDRILGSGDFVDFVLEAKRKTFDASVVSVDSILEEVSASTGVAAAIILGQSRERVVSKARMAFFVRAHDEIGISAAELGRMTGRTHTAVLHLLDKARRKKDEEP